MDRQKIGLLWLGLIVIAVLAVGLFIWSFIFDGDNDVILGFTVAAISVIVFFGFMYISRSGGIDQGGMRNAITAAAITVYFIILTLSVFLKSPTSQQGISNTMITSFTSIVGIVIAFYFGASAYVQVQTYRANNEEKSEKKNTQE